MKHICLFSLLWMLNFQAVAARGDDSAKPNASRTVYVGVREPEGLAEGQYDGILFRELLRQALMIAARDELGLATRDRTLREEIPKSTDAKAGVFEIVPTIKAGETHKITVQVTRRNGEKDKPQSLLEKTLVASQGKLLVTLAEQGEQLSRGEFVELLKQQGFGGETVPKARETSEIPKEIPEHLGEWNEVAQFAAIRKLHDDARANGESPELLAALAIGYANLGSLAEYHWSPAHKAYKARALLYVERLLQRSGKSAWGLAHRGYVRVLVGLHVPADEDLQAARKLATEKPGPHPLPEWVDLLESFVAGKMRALAEVKTSHPQVRLAHYLHMLAIEMSGAENDIRRSCARLLEESPDCFRAMETFASTGSLGITRTVSFQNMVLFPRSLAKRLGDVPGLPDSPKAYVKAIDRDGDDLSDEVELRAELIANLKEAGQPEKDRAEPSLAAFGHLIEEISFFHVWRVLDYQRNSLGVPCNEALAEYRPLYEPHCWGVFMGVFSDNPNEPAEACRKLIESVDVSELELSEGPMYRWAYWYNPSRGQGGWNYAAIHADALFRDQLQMYALREKKTDELPAQQRSTLVKVLRDISPKMPAVIAAGIDLDWQTVAKDAEQFEKEHADDWPVLAALSRRYADDKRWKEAERCLKRMMELQPHIDTCEQLAEAQRHTEGEKAWKETLLKALDLPSFGLETTRIRVRLANYHENRKEYEEALVYAEEAAQSWASWAMTTAARCHEHLSHWKEAEEWTRNNAERYDGARLEWLLWCQRTGKGDVKAAQQLALEYFESLGAPLPAYALEQIGIYYLLTDEPDKAQAVFEEAYRQGSDPYMGMQVALLADQAGNAALRDETLKKIVDFGQAVKEGKQGTRLDKNYVTLYMQLASILQQNVKSPDAKDWNPSLIEALRKDASQGEPTNIDYFVGKFLKLRGNEEESRKMLKRAASSPMTNKFNHVFALRELRAQKITPDPRREKEVE